MQKRVITLSENDIFNTIFTKGTKANDSIKRKKLKDSEPSSPAPVLRKPAMMQRRMTRKVGGGGIGDHGSSLDINLILMAA